MKCCTCGKEIQNTYYLNGKCYGRNCYKIALAQWKLEKQQLLNDKYAAEVAKCIEIYRQKTFTKQYNTNFQISIINQYDQCKKLTAKQLSCIKKSFNEEDKIKYHLLDFDLAEGEKFLKDKNGQYLTYKKSGTKIQNTEKIKIANRVLNVFQKMQNDNFKKALELLNKMLDNKSFIDAIKYSIADTEEENVYIIQNDDFVIFANSRSWDKCYKALITEEDYKLIKVI